uniref:Uncharacterized protein n=1 Tax=Trypanosoma congolense (strain IL3000) TaxID=1068625 RepID=G0UN58_TRYCI|nr:hypothetical protein, unlikely [Trypanosoma congolense IL3000]
MYENYSSGSTNKNVEKSVGTTINGKGNKKKREIKVPPFCRVLLSQYTHGSFRDSFLSSFILFTHLLVRFPSAVGQPINLSFFCFLFPVPYPVSLSLPLSVLCCADVWLPFY